MHQVITATIMATALRQILYFFSASGKLSGIQKSIRPTTASMALLRISTIITSTTELISSTRAGNRVHIQPAGDNHR